jgi:phosphoglycerate dehydrogenase-like enzyme
MQTLLDGRLPPGVDAVYVASAAEALAEAPEAEIGWFDVPPFSAARDSVAAAPRLRWVSTMLAGLDYLPLGLLGERGVMVTNGAGLHAIPCAEYVLMGMLAAAKNYLQIARAQDRGEWLKTPPGVIELADSTALIIGYGQIGQAIAERLRAFGVAVTGVRRRAGDDPAVIGADAWRGRLGEFDWVILAAPATGETAKMIGAEELSRMKPGARLVNVARGALVDQPALVAALQAGTLAGAVLDVTDPEPLPKGDPLWGVPGAIITMHLSGPSQTRLPERAAALFLDNVHRFVEGRPLRNQVDLKAGY